MTLRPCSREKEVAQLLALGHWPQAASPELRVHLAACRPCAELVLITSAFQSARAQAVSAAPHGSAGAIWWRAQLRRRNQAVERVSRPILGAHIFALAVYFVAALVLVVSQATHGLRWLSWFRTGPDQLSPFASLNLQALNPSSLLASGWSLMVLVPVLATLALLAGVAVYLGSERQ